MRELYDLRVDPGELRNLVEQRTEAAAELAATLHAWRTRSGSPVDQPIPGDVLERLRSLGYVK